MIDSLEKRIEREEKRRNKIEREVTIVGHRM